MDSQGLRCQEGVQFQKGSLRKKWVMCPGIQIKKCVVTEMYWSQEGHKQQE